MNVPPVCPLRKPVVFPAVSVLPEPDYGGLPAPLSAAEWAFHQRRWLEAVARYEACPQDLYTAWHWLDMHPMFWTFRQGGSAGLPRDHVHRMEHNHGVRRCVTVRVVRPEPGVIQPCLLGTQVWLEAGPAQLFDDSAGFHDWDLDVGEETYELAIVALAWEVWQAYGNDRRRCGHRRARGEVHRAPRNRQQMAAGHPA